MIDSHCHLDHEPLLSNIDKIISNSKKHGIEKILTICTTTDSFKSILKLINLDPIIFGTFGIHPHETKFFDISKDKIIKNVKSNNKVIGVGETGLDFYYENSEKDLQIKSFIKHIEASIDLDLPVIVHSRNAEKKTFELLNSYKNTNIKILMHCFTGSYDFAKKLLDLNSYFSASGIITFKNSKSLQDTFKKIPVDNIMVETDSPFLTPEPFRGKKNEPSFVRYTLKKLSEIKNLEISNLDKLTTKNFNKLFFSDVD